MIRLNSDCLIFQTSNGEHVPCTAETVTIELLGDAAEWIDPEIIQNASAAVLHYFKDELGRESVSVGEFSVALERVLRGLGFRVTSEPDEPAQEGEVRVAETDLREVATACAGGFELSFFPHLRDEMRRKMDGCPHVLRFKGLRGCVKQLTGAQRWSPRCQSLNDQIVEYLRTCLTNASGGDCCALVVM